MSKQIECFKMKLTFIYLFTSVSLPEIWAYNGDENKNVAMCVITPGSSFCGYQHVEKYVIVTFNPLGAGIFFFF